MKEMLDFLFDLAFDLYKHLSSNLKLEIFENLFHTLKSASDHKVSSLKVLNNNYIDYLVSKEKSPWKYLLQFWKISYPKNIQILMLIFIFQQEVNMLMWG